LLEEKQLETYQRSVWIRFQLILDDSNWNYGRQ